jgi:hypothetical protein
MEINREALAQSAKERQITKSQARLDRRNLDRKKKVGRFQLSSKETSTGS